jgi:invasion protein IalB
MAQIVRFLVFTSVAALVACATQAPATSASSGAGQGSSSATASNAAYRERQLPGGYYHKVVDGQDLYCRNDPIPGSRLEKKEVCLTQEQLNNQQQASQNTINNIQNSGVR